MKTNKNFYSTQTYSLKRYNNLLNLSNLKKINKPKIYHPINPCHPFNLDMLNLKQISKRENAVLINNKPLKDIILKYNLDERKTSNDNHDPNKYLFNKFKDEEKKYQLTIRAILKKNIDNFPLYLSESKSHNKKQKLNLKFHSSRNDSTNSNQKKSYTSYSQIRPLNSIKSDLLKERRISQYISKNEIKQKLLFYKNIFFEKTQQNADIIKSKHD